jgi:hypothetical protein
LPAHDVPRRCYKRRAYGRATIPLEQQDEWGHELPGGWSWPEARTPPRAAAAAAAARVARVDPPGVCPHTRAKHWPCVKGVPRKESTVATACHVGVAATSIVPSRSTHRKRDWFVRQPRRQSSSGDVVAKPDEGGAERSPRPAVWDVIRRITSETAGALKPRSRRVCIVGAAPMSRFDQTDSYPGVPPSLEACSLRSGAEVSTRAPARRPVR